MSVLYFSDNVISNSELSDELKGAALGLLQEASLRQDVVVLISNDPQQHVIKWLHNIDKKSDTVQERIIKVVSTRENKICISLLNIAFLEAITCRPNCLNCLWDVERGRWGFVKCDVKVELFS